MKNKSIGLWLILIILFLGMGYVSFRIFGNESFNVRFDSNGGSAVSSIRVLKDEILEVAPKSIREGYQFLGWYLNDEKFNFDKPLEEDVTLVAKWTFIDDKTYILSFDSLGDAEVSEIEVQANEVLSEVPVPKKDGYQFEGWYYHNKKFDFTSQINSNMTLIAKWRKSE